MKKICLVLLFALALPALRLAASDHRAFFVLADFYDARLTREHGGDLKAWSQNRRPEKSPGFSNTYFTFQADLLDEAGRPQLAALDFPQIGMYSTVDPDAVEYCLLLAKTSGIDAFLFENILSRAFPAFRKAAERFGVDVFGAVDNLSIVEWARKNGMADASFDEKARAFLAAFTGESTWPCQDGRPLVLLWQLPEANRRAIVSLYRDENRKPLFYYWYLLTAKLDDGAPRFQPFATLAKDFSYGLQFQPWVPPRVRPRDESHPHWDACGTEEDAMAYLEHIRSEAARYPESQTHPFSLVTPGFDNRPCAGWSRSLALLEGNGGRLYEAMWKYTLEHTNHFRSAYIATWNDWTESTAIEPAEKSGLRDLRATQRYSRLCKGLPPLHEELPGLPIRLFRLRKNVAFLREVGIATTALEKNADEASAALSALDYGTAARILQAGEALANEARKNQSAVEKLPSAEPSPLAGSDQAYRLPSTIQGLLRQGHWEGTLSFEWLDEGRRPFSIRGQTRRSKDFDVADYAAIAQLVTTGTGAWKKGRVALLRTNLVFGAEGAADFEVKGNVQVRNLRAEFTRYLLKM